MKTLIVNVIAASVLVSLPAFSQDNQRRAVMRGDSNDGRGKCTIEVVVDGVAEVEVRGDNAFIRTLSGQPAQFRRFECNSPMPQNPYDFRFAGVDGRGRQDLIQDPGNRGAAVVRIEDPKGGAEGYTFDLFWSRQGGVGNYAPGVPDRRPPDRYTSDNAIQDCQEMVRREADNRSRFGGRDIVFRRTNVDVQSNRRDVIEGIFDIRRAGLNEVWSYSCAVNVNTGRVLSARINPANGDFRGGDRDNVSNAGAIQGCQRAVETRVRRDGYDRVEFVSINADNRPGRNDWVVGEVRAFGRGNRGNFEFSCSVDLRTGGVRSVDVRLR